MSNCGQNIESSTYFFLQFHFFIKESRTLLSTIRSRDSKLLDGTNYDLTQMLLFGNSSQISSNNFKVTLIDYILSSKRFDSPLFWIKFLISISKFIQHFSFFILLLLLCFILFYFFYLPIYFFYLPMYYSCFILPGTSQYIGILRSCNLFVYFFRLYFTWSEL